MTSTGRRPGASAAERKRRQRERDREQQLVYETPDWRLFTDLATLPQKAGCQPRDLRRIVLKELVDNALDTGAGVSLEYMDGIWTVTDDGPGLAPVDVRRLFAVNRPLLSSKLVRRPLRGMLGNGLRVVVGAVAATVGRLVVETREHRLTLSVCHQTGQTTVISDERIPRRSGLKVRLSLGNGDETDGSLARVSIAAAKCGKAYAGASSPWWYGGKDLHKLFTQVTPAETTVADVCRSLGANLDDGRVARTLSRDDTDAVLTRIRAGVSQLPPESLGFVGPEFQNSWPGYARKTGTRKTQADAVVPLVVEAWATCSPPAQKGQGRLSIHLLLNRSMTVATIHAVSRSRALVVRGCGLDRQVNASGTGDYDVMLSVIAPYIQLATDGKEPSLAPFSEAIAEVLRKACGMAHHAMHRPEKGVTVKDAAWAVMKDAYQTASGNGQYPANARQIMYAARPEILRRTGKTKLDNAYFTQNLLPDYISEHPRETAAWDVVFDARGSLTEPHTGHDVPLGTIDVRAYLGERSSLGPAVALTLSERYPTSGPRHRYSAVLFIEKEGFAPLLQAARIAERFDVAVMSTKGMSTTAARLLLDRLAPQIEKVLVLHDFDVSGFSIFGTLRTDGRRYQFKNVLPIADIGLRLADVEELDLQSEPVEISGSWDTRSATLAAHGATRSEVTFLSGRRVELNAMPAGVFVSFLERKLTEHGIRKVVPDCAILEVHARRLIEQRLVKEALLKRSARFRAEAALANLPENLDARVRAFLNLDPELSWDQAIAVIVGDTKAA